METATCIHREQISSLESGIEQGVCSICHQVRRYEWREVGGKAGRITKIVKLGRLDGKVVLPRLEDIVDLSPEETAELKKARKDGKSVPKPANPGTEEKTIAKGREWYQYHKAEMIEDLLTMDTDAFYKKWPIKRQILSHLKSDPLYRGRVAGKETTQELKKGGRNKKVKRHQMPKRGSPPIEDVVDALKRAKADKLPSFPEWAPEKWTSSEIAVQWLRTYKALSGMQLVLFLSQNSQSAPAAPAAKAKRGNWLRRLFKQ